MPLLNPRQPARVAAGPTVDMLGQPMTSDRGSTTPCPIDFCFLTVMLRDCDVMKRRQMHQDQPAMAVLHRHCSAKQPSGILPELSNFVHVEQGAGGGAELAGSCTHRGHSACPGRIHHGPLCHVHVLGLLRQRLATARLQLQVGLLVAVHVWGRGGGGSVRRCWSSMGWQAACMVVKPSCSWSPQPRAFLTLKACLNGQGLESLHAWRSAAHRMGYGHARSPTALPLDLL